MTRGFRSSSHICEEVMRLMKIGDGLTDGPDLTEQEAEALDAHVEGCPACRDEEACSLEREHLRQKSRQHHFHVAN